MYVYISGYLSKKQLAKSLDPVSHLSSFMLLAACRPKPCTPRPHTLNPRP